MSARNMIRTVAFLVAITICTGATGLRAQSAKVDISGAWTFSVNSDAGASMPAVTFKQEGEKLTGHYSSMLLGEAELTGTVKGEAVEFVVRAEVQGIALELRYTGTLDGKDSMKGKLSTAGLGDGTFTAKRK